MDLGRKRARAELLAAVRAELEATRSEMRAALGEVAARVEQRLETRLGERERADGAVFAQLGAVGSRLGERLAEFELALERIARTCDVAVQTVHMNRAERLALLDAIEELTARLPGILPAGSRSDPATGSGLKVVGGHVNGDSIAGPTVPDPAEPVDIGNDELANRRPDIPPEHPAAASRQVIRLDGVEVRCRFDGDHWVGGFEVAEVVRDAEGIQYRLRRRADGYELPRLFSDRDVRDVDPPHLREVPRR